MHGTFEFKKPNLGVFDLGAPINQSVGSDGAILWDLINGKEYIVPPADALTRDSIGKHLAPPVSYFFDQGLLEMALVPGSPVTARYVGIRNDGDADFEVVEVKIGEETSQMYIGAYDLVHRLRQMNAAGVVTTDIELTNIRVNVPISNDEFAKH
jgi:hypothetical protein